MADEVSDNSATESKYVTSEQIVAFLVNLMKDGAVPSKRVHIELKRLGIPALSPRFQKLKKKLKIYSMLERNTDRPKWHWWMDGTPEPKGGIKNWKTSLQMAEDKKREKLAVKQAELAELAHGIPLSPIVVSKELVKTRRQYPLSLEDLPNLSYHTADDKRDCKRCCEAHGVWDGDLGFYIRMEGYRLSDVKPISRCWHRAACDLLKDIHHKKLKPRYIPKSRKRSSGDEAAIERLMKVGRGKRSVPREELRWVVTNVPVVWEEIEPEGVPSDYAVSLLVLAKENRGDFLKIVASKLIPTKLEDEGDRGFVDDGRVDSLLESQIRELAVG